MSNDLNHNMEPAFTRALYFESTQVPDYLLNNYQAIGLSDQQFIDLLRVLACQQKFLPYVEQDKLLAKWNGQQAEMSAALAALQQQGVLQRLDDVPGVVYSLEGLYAKLLELWVFQHSVPAPTSVAEAEAATSQQIEEKEIIRAAYQLFEGEFARPLSPLELEKLNAWLIADRWDFTLLKEAMRRAVLHNALNLAYIDKILLRWRREGITNMEQLLASEARQEAAAADKPARNDKQSRSARSARNKPQAAEPGFAAEVDYAQYF